MKIEMLRDALASLTGGAPQRLRKGTTHETSMAVAAALFEGRDLPEDERSPAAKPAGAPDEWRDEEPEWDLQMKPATYLAQHPSGPNATTARWLVARQLVGSNSPREASTAPSES